MPHPVTAQGDDVTATSGGSSSWVAVVIGAHRVRPRRLRRHPLPAATPQRRRPAQPAPVPRARRDRSTPPCPLVHRRRALGLSIRTERSVTRLDPNPDLTVRGRSASSGSGSSATRRSDVVGHRRARQGPARARAARRPHRAARARSRPTSSTRSGCRTSSRSATSSPASTTPSTSTSPSSRRVGGRVLGVLRPRPLDDALQRAGRAARPSSTRGWRSGRGRRRDRPGRAPRVVAEPPALAPGHGASSAGSRPPTTSASASPTWCTAFVFFLIGGAMAELMRAQLAQPDQDLVSEDRYNQLFTMHGTIMLLLFVSPFAFGPGQLPRAAADRRPGHGLPPAQRPRLLAHAVRRHRDAGRVPHRRRRRQVRLVRLRAAVGRRALARRRRRPVDRGHRPPGRVRRHHRASTSSPPCPPCGRRA